MDTATAPHDVAKQEKTEEEEELVEKKVAIDLNMTSEAQLDDLMPEKKRKSESEDDEEEEEKEANCTALPSTKHHPCSDDGKLEEGNNDSEVNVVEELESSESLFSLSIDSRKKHHQISAEIDEEVTSSSRPPFSFPISGFTTTHEGKSSTSSSTSEFNHSVLKPLENLSGWKTPLDITAATSSSSPFKTIITKGNNNDDDEEEEEKENTRSLEQQKREAAAAAAVDDTTSLSSWLVDSDSTSFKSVGNINNKKKKKSPDDETTTTGTVASYWLHTGQAAATPDSGFTSKKQKQTDKEIKFASVCLPSQLLQ